MVVLYSFSHVSHVALSELLDVGSTHVMSVEANSGRLGLYFPPFSVFSLSYPVT